MKPLALLALFAATVQAANWPNWRGPEYNGSTDEKNLPTTWSSTENVAWKAPLPGPSGSTPIVWNDHIFVHSPDENKNLVLIALNREDGSVRWTKLIGIGDRTVGRNNMASPSPVTDGKIVVSLFGTGDLAAFDFDGKELWKKSLAEEFGKFAIMWIYGSSPLLHDGKLYIQVLQTTPVPESYTHAQDEKKDRESFLLCLDPQNGKEIFRHIRPSNAKKESLEAYTTPIPFESQILIVGGDYATGHDKSNGKEIWRVGGLNPRKDPWWRIVPTPVVAGNHIFAAGPKRDPLYAIKKGGAGDITATHVTWSNREYHTDWSTPLYYNGKLYVLDGSTKQLTCLHPDTGEKIWQGKIPDPGVIWSSPTGADGKIYNISESGTVYINDAQEFKTLATIPMGEAPVRSTIVAAQGQLFIRTAENLYCIGKK